MSKRIAIVEDEVELAKNYRATFEREGFDVRLYADRASAEADFRNMLPDLAILDVGLGEEPDGGFELCRFLRSASATLPIIILTALDSEIDEIVGLKVGANDYLTKEISQALLVTRVRTLLKYVQVLQSQTANTKLIKHGPLMIDIDRLLVTWNGESVELSVTEFLMVEALARYPGQLKTRQQLMEAAGILVDEHTVTSHIKRIRRKFEDVDGDAGPIQAEYGAGYRWRSQTT
jgi:two-component system OmpR family response regulator